MAYNVSRSLGRDVLPQPEILVWPLSVARIPSVVLNATGVAAQTSGPYTGRRYLLAGTILSKRGDGQYEEFTAAGGQAVEAILFRTTEFADGTNASDKPVAIIDKLTAAVDFNKANIPNFVTHETALRAAFTKCNFE